MSDAGMRIDRANPILQNPDFFSRSPLKNRSKEEEQVSPLNEKQVREQKQTTKTAQRETSSRAETAPSSLKRKREDDSELLPQIKRARAELPEKAEEKPNFNRNVWSSAKPTDAAKQQPIIGAHRKEIPSAKIKTMYEDPLLNFPKGTGYYVARIIGASYELHMNILDQQYEVFKVTSHSQERLREEKVDLIKKQIANGELQAEWSLWKSSLEYFSITGQATIGAGLLFTGNVPAGATMLAGSALSLSGKLIRDRTDYYKTGAALSLAGGLTSAYGGATNLAALGVSDLPGKLSTATEITSQGASAYIERRKNQAQADQMGIKAEDIMNGHKQELSKQEMEKLVGSFAVSHPEKAMAAAAKLIETEHKIKSELAAAEKV